MDLQSRKSNNRRTQSRHSRKNKKKAKGKDKEVVKVIKKMKKVRVRRLQGEKLKIEGNLVLKKGKIYVSKNKKLRVEIIWLHYDVPAVGYGGKYKMIELVTRNYQWPEMWDSM